MINPNHYTTTTAIVLKAEFNSRFSVNEGAIKCLKSGRIFTEVELPKTTKVGQFVRGTVNYSCVSDRYVIRNVSKVYRATGLIVERLVRYAYAYGYRLSYSDTDNRFCLNGKDSLTLRQVCARLSTPHIETAIQAVKDIDLSNIDDSNKDKQLYNNLTH